MSTLVKITLSVLNLHTSIYVYLQSLADAPLNFLRETKTGENFEQAGMNFDATFGDYQYVRMRIILEKFGSDLTDDVPDLNPKFVNVVKIWMLVIEQI